MMPIIGVCKCINVFLKLSLVYLGMRHFVCGTLNHKEGSADNKIAQLNNIHED
jgi:hypothetical protein